MLPYVYRVTKYDPADRNEHGHYTGAEPVTSDHGPVEAAYLRAVAAFAEETGVNWLAIREPQIGGFAHFGLEPPVDGYGLGSLFPAGLTGFHDGALVPIPVGLELVRAMLRDNGAWCRLEAEGAFAVHIGWDQYLYVGSGSPCDAALNRTRSLGLFPERLHASPYDFAPDDPQHVQRPADADFWRRLHWAVSAHRATFLEEIYAANASRWHRLTRDNIEAVRAQLTPRAQLAVWPDLLTDADAAIASLPDEGLVEIIWEDADGRITSTVADESQFEAVTSQLASASAAGVVSPATDERHPLFTAVLPDSDGVLRARWQTEPTPSDRDWAFLKTLRRGQVVTGTVTSIAGFGVTFVDIGGFTAMINIPELSWRPINHPSDVVSVGREITAEVLDVDMVRERVPLSLRAVQEDPWPQVAQRIGQVVTGPVTKIMPFGVFVRIEEREDGFEGLVHTSELDESTGDVVEVGDILTVKITDVDLTRRRIGLSQTQARTPRHEGDRHS
ncbi:S1 RNA-binding domain-containing protein [Streptomyces canus]|uniref:RNA-binding protein with RPS1 domain n=1 Tax=Streptomyces canus TaxID=58343 RepID=A0AAW8FA85_9ACTN|nr:S1 RNA-binding domain-containing protein [Streptomyces canus]MDQ0764795.1 putative RNA-binding protein with RPS1 domain [Streptomyces canus]MDQ0906747.1 putative RNA-binding protein with RPS1 domain [Streptomyces canus]MDQ1066766.1 putative RNA-binding protein with RPS1 domain [Streptomyces canus]